MDLFDLAATALILAAVIYIGRTIFNLPKILEQLEAQLKSKMELAQKELANDLEASSNVQDRE